MPSNKVESLLEIINSLESPEKFEERDYSWNRVMAEAKAIAEHLVKKGFSGQDIAMIGEKLRLYGEYIWLVRAFELHLKNEAQKEAINKVIKLIDDKINLIDADIWWHIDQNFTEPHEAVLEELRSLKEDIERTFEDKEKGEAS